MSGRRKGRDRSNEPSGTTPDAFPTSPPPGLQVDNHSWVLQTIMDLKGSTAELAQCVKTLDESTKEQGKKLDSISHRMYAATAIVGVVGTVLSICGVIAMFVIEKAADRVLEFLSKMPAAGGG